MAPASFSYANLPLPDASKVPSNIKLREALATDASAMADCWFTSFYPSHNFWTAEFRPEYFHPWWFDAWTMGIVDDPTTRIFVAVDMSYAVQTNGVTNSANIGSSEFESDLDKRFPALVSDGKIVGFTRWRVPQEDGNLDDKWPAPPEGEGIDMGIMGPFFNGMHVNRNELMGKNPHWFLEMLGTTTTYQGQGIGHAFAQWGCDLADKDDLEVYIDASEKGAPFYAKNFGAIPRKDIPIPDKESFGRFNYLTFVRPKITERTA